MRKDRSVIFQFDPEIERTVKRLRREQRNSKTVSEMDNLQDMGNLDPHRPLQPVNIQEGQMNTLIKDNQTTTISFIWQMTEIGL